MFDVRHFANLSTSEVGSLLETEISGLYHQWKASLPFDVHVISDKCTVISNDLLDQSLERVDICDYLGGAKYPAFRLYFCRSTYPPPLPDELVTESGKDTCPGWMSLRRDLGKAAFEAGNPIMSNGNSGTSTHGKVFRCSGWRKFLLSQPKCTTTKEYRKTTLINNEKGNRRNEGKTKPRRSKTRVKTCPCPFNFRVSWDSFGFYVYLARKSGDSHHHYHPRAFHTESLPMPTRLLDTKEKAETKGVSDATCSDACGRNFAFAKFRRFVSQAKIAWMDSGNKPKNSNTTDDISNMLQSFENSNEIKFTTLSDIPLSDFTNTPAPPSEEDTITVCTTKSDNGDIINTPISEMPVLAPLKDIATDTRRLQKKNKQLFIHGNSVDCDSRFSVLGALP